MVLEGPRSECLGSQGQGALWILHQPKCVSWKGEFTFSLAPYLT